MDSTQILKSAFVTLGELTPGPLAALAERFFTQPRRIPAPPREIPWRDDAEHATVDTPVGPVHTLTWTQATLPWERQDTPRGTVLLVHGWEGRGSQLCAFVEPLLAQGFRVVAFDGPAHGDSPGDSADVLVFSLALRAVAETYGDVRAVIAHSMGGGATTVAVADGLDVDAVVLVAPPLSADTVTDDFCAALGMTPSTRAAFKQRLKRRFHTYAWNRLAFADFADEHADMPCLIVHDVDDVEVPFERGSALHAAWPGARFVATRGLGHRKILREPSVVADVVAFVGEKAP